MKKRMVMFAIAGLILCAADEGSSQERMAQGWRVGYTKVAITHVYTRDPREELESKTTYLDEETLGLVREADQEELRCPSYFVVKFLKPGVHEVSLTCRADGNHQVIAFSPRAKAFKRMDYRGALKSMTIVFDFDASDSPYLVFNCTAGNLFVDAIKVKPVAGEISRKGDGRKTRSDSQRNNR